MKSIEKINFNHLQFKLELNENLSELKKEIIFEHEHFVRGDMSEYMVRSTIPRLTYADASIPAHDTDDLNVGDIVVLNDDLWKIQGNCIL